ncbi:hypothetical protein ABPG74_020786 [Tetrahymena malaccensis]
MYLSIECFQSQPDNTYCDANLECQTCTNTLCLTCAQDLNKCITCKNNDYLFQDNCQSTKPNAAYCDENTKKCEKCADESCQTCNEDKNKCTLCDQNSTKKYNYQNQCFDQKPDNTQCDSNNICTGSNCPQNCKNCDSSNPKICQQCEDKYYQVKYSFETKCEKDPPMDYLCVGFVCNTKCAPQCRSCQGTETDCASCGIYEYLFKNRCHSQKQESTFCTQQDPNAGQICNLCTDFNCLECKSSNQCSKCQSYAPYLLNDWCIQGKKDGVYCDEATKICENCSVENCKTCNENKDQCTLCNEKMPFLYQNECFLNQPPNTECDSNKVCTQPKCPLNCKNCDSSNPKICKQCEDKYYLVDYTSETKCETEPPKNYLCVDFVCSGQCASQCGSCQGTQTDCTSCSNKNDYLFNKKCESQKPEGTFCTQDPQIGQICSLCTDKNCLECKSSNQCSKCQTSAPYLLNDLCFSEKKDGTYCDDTTKICENCSVENCKTCNENKDQCTLCNEKMPFFYQNKCLLNQPPNTECDSNKVCTDSKCPLNCKNCVNNLCTECNQPYFLLKLETETCVDQNQIPKNVFCEDHVCFKCSDDCGSCQNKKDNCTSCNDPKKYLLDNKCYQDQPQNSFCSDKFVCQNCVNKGCKQCQQNLNDCINCLDNLYLFQNNCSQTQPSSTFCDNQTKVCQKCKIENCTKCAEDVNKCTKCDEPKKFIYKDQCLQEKPTNAYCDENLICQSCKEKDCLQCGSNLECILKGCKKSEYTYNGACSSKMPENAYCDSKTNECQKCINLACYSCQSDLNTCIECLEDSYFYENKCHDKKPKHVFCKKQEKLKVCQPCHELCSECSGPSELECENCYPDSVLSKGKCIKSALEFKSSISVEQVVQIENQAASTSQATSSSSTALSLSSNLVSRSSFGLVVSGLTSQKLTYMVLVDTSLPAAAFTILKSFKDQLPQNQMKFLNIFTKLIDFSDDEVKQYLDIRFESVQLNYNILNNCGQGISIFLICYFFFVLSYLLIEKSSVKKLSNFSSTLYSKLTCGMIIQYFQICLSIFVVGINAQILEFIYEEKYEMSGVKITLIILLIVVVVYIIYLLYKYLNIGQMQKGVQNFYEITREKILNETIYESKIRRNFILIYLLIDSIIIPTIFLQLFFNSLLASSLAIFFQLAFLIIVCALMPFHSKLTNGYFIVSSILWVTLYITYLLLNIYSSKSDIDSYANTLDHLTWVFFITIQIILLSNPAYMVLNLVVKLVEFISQKINQRRLKQQQAERQSQLEQEINFNSVQYIQQASLNILMDDVSTREIDSQSKYTYNRYNWINKLK